MLPPMRFVATGDSFITRRLPSSETLWQLADIVRDADVRFTNFEVLTPGDAFPNAVSGGTWAKAPEGVIGDLQSLGFNMLSWASNHTLDYAYDGLANTAAALDRSGIVHAGVGRNLAEAAAPRYLECPQGRVALIGICSTFHETSPAGQTRPDMQGRPGINPLRFTTTHTLPREQLDALSAMAEASGINDGLKMRIKSGFAKPPEAGTVMFGGHTFKEGAPGTTTEANKADVTRTLASISEARRQGDYVLVSLHAHEALGTDKAIPAAFLVDFSRACIDAGAHAVIGHGPHVLRGVEIFQKRPIFHSLNVYGTKRTFVNDQPDAKVFSGDSAADQAPFTTPYPGMEKGDLLPDFIDAIRTGREPLVSARDVFRVMDICFAAWEATNQGRTVQVQYLL